MHEPGRGVHDMGGQPGGPVERREHDYAWWEKRVDALLVLLSNKHRRIMTVDELRRGIEGLGVGAYDRMTYYERWIASITQNLIEKGILSIAELRARMEEIEKRPRDGRRTRS